MVKETIRNIIFSYGADVCGFAGIERFKESQEGFSPLDIFPDCRSVIVFGIALPRGLAVVSPRLIYGHFNNQNSAFVDKIAFQAAKEIEKTFTCTAVPVPSDDPYEYWESDKLEGRGLISMKYAAFQAGIGCIGKNTLLMNEEYGTLLTIGAILVDIKLASDALHRALCIDGCSKCIKSCPAGAISANGVNQKMCRLGTYGKTKRGFATVDCNICRTVCPLTFGVQHIK